MFTAAHRWLNGPMSRITTVASLVGASVLVSILASCSKPQTQPPATLVPLHTRPVLHAVYGKELRMEMHDLHVQASQQEWLQRQPGWEKVSTRRQPVVDMQQVSRAADRMAQVASDGLPPRVANIQIEPKNS